MAEPYDPSPPSRGYRLSGGSGLRGGGGGGGGLPIPGRQTSVSSIRKDSTYSNGTLPTYDDGAAQQYGQQYDQHYKQQGREWGEERQGGQGANQPSAQMLKIKRTQEEINLVKDQLAENIEAIQERGERLDHLKDKSDHLSIQSQQFRTQATAVRRKMWWKNAKWMICIGVLLIVVIAGAVGGGVKGHQYIEEHKTVTETATATQPPQTVATPAGSTRAI